jgi:hypothetical protein
MLREFPECPICRSTDGYKIGEYHLVVMAECENCRARWGSPQFLDLKPMKEITLWRTPKDGRYLFIEKISKPVTFWRIGGRLTTEGERKKTLMTKRYGNVPLLVCEEPIMSLSADWHAIVSPVGGERNLYVYSILTNKRLIFLKTWLMGGRKGKIDYALPLDEIDSACPNGVITLEESPCIRVKLKNGEYFRLLFTTGESMLKYPGFLTFEDVKPLLVTIENRWATAINNAVAGAPNSNSFLYPEGW